MNVNELRIGNLINAEDISMGKAEVYPIPLNSEWLIQFGFKPFSKDWSKKGIIIHTRKRGYVLRTSVPIIQHVHQLQNLFFALTGQELTINSPL